MKNLFKKYLWLIIVIVVSFAFIMLSVLWVGFFIIGSFLLSISFFVLAAKARNRYNELSEISEENFYFDGTKYDFDEDVYYLTDRRNKNSGIKKNVFSKFNARMPMTICIILGLAFLSFGGMMAFTCFFK